MVSHKISWLENSSCSTICKLCLHNALMLLLLGVGSCIIPGCVCPCPDSSRLKCWIVMQALLTVLEVGEICLVPPSCDPCLLQHLTEGGSCFASAAEPRDLYRSNHVNQITCGKCTARALGLPSSDKPEKFGGSLNFLKIHIIIGVDLAENWSTSKPKTASKTPELANKFLRYDSWFLLLLPRLNRCGHNWLVSSVCRISSGFNPPD